MPRKTIEGNFKIRPDYDVEEELRASLEETRTYFDKLLSCIDKIEDDTLQLICLFSLIDALAQEEANYPSDFKTGFCDFVLRHQKQCDYLECVEPVTLYYHAEEIVGETVILPYFPFEGEMGLEDLSEPDYNTVESIISNNKSNEILNYIAKTKGADYASVVSEKHKLIILLYRMRSKAVHEMSDLGLSRKIYRNNPNKPYYCNMGRIYVENDKMISDDVFELFIPNVFIRNILADCIDGYLAKCAEDKRFPFSNNKMTRKHTLSWYDK